VGHHGSQQQTDKFSVTLLLLRQRHEVMGEIQLVVHFNEQVRQLDNAQVLAIIPMRWIYVDMAAQGVRQAVMLSVTM
jgi:hypothetical protein